jgi:hypothetical protein
VPRPNAIFFGDGHACSGSKHSLIEPEYEAIGDSGRNSMSAIRLFIQIVDISHRKGVYMFYDLNHDDSIYIQFMI